MQEQVFQKIAEKLGVSRATVSRAIRSLMNKGVRFTVDIPDNSPRAFIITRRPYERLGECYKLIDGRYLIIIKARDYNELVRVVEGVDDKMGLFIAIGGCW